ncbi:MAG TPA: hypothetical protein VF035_03420 [Longimicrobiales bacterium]
MTIEDAVAAAATELMAVDGVEGVGQGICAGTPCIRVYVQTAAAAASLPETFHGHPVDPVITGRIEAPPTF